MELKMPLNQVMNLSRWPRMKEITELIAVKGEDFAAPEYHQMLQDCVAELTVTIVALNKQTNQASLLAAQTDWKDPPTGGPSMYGIENMGDHGFCTPRGKLSKTSHG